MWSCRLYIRVSVSARKGCGSRRTIVYDSNGASLFLGSNAPPREGHPESHYLVEDGTVMLSDAAGKPLPGERYRRKLGPEDDEMVVARQLLRSQACSGRW